MKIKDYRVNKTTLSDVCIDCFEFLNHPCVECVDCPVKRLRDRLIKAKI